jgi:hypothetical protein
LLRFDDSTICSVPPQWTDVVAADPEIVMGQGRALFRVTDLMELGCLVARMAAAGRTECKENSAAFVKQMTPL